MEFDDQEKLFEFGANVYYVLELEQIPKLAVLERALSRASALIEDGRKLIRELTLGGEGLCYVNIEIKRLEDFIQRVSDLSEKVRGGVSSALGSDFR